MRSLVNFEGILLEVRDNIPKINSILFLSLCKPESCSRIKNWYSHFVLELDMCEKKNGTC